MNHLVIHAERCVHQRVVGAACAACQQACPRGAWRVNDEGLGFDPDACDDCGLCVAACPTEALSLPAPRPLIHPDAQGRRVLRLACERAGVPGTAGVTPCLYALSPGWLLRAAQAAHVDQILLSPGDCAQCPRGSAGPTWRAQWLGVVQRLQAQGRAAPALRPVPASDWPSETADAGRRRWFTSAVGAATKSIHDSPLSSARSWTTQHLKPATPTTRAAPLWSVTLNAALCTVCQACTRLCPSGALRIEPTGDAAPAFAIDRHACTGCGLCAPVCEAGALSAPHRPPVDDAAAPQPVVQRLPLQADRCRACGVGFHVLATAVHGASPGLCLACQRGRPMPHNRIVQQDASA